MSSTQELTTDELKIGIEERLKELHKRGENIEDYLGDLLIKCNDSNENEHKQNIKQNEISTLVDFKNNKNGMCDRGHDMGLRKKFRTKDVCNVCGSSSDVGVCATCCSDHMYKAGGGKECVWCQECAINNVNKLKIKWERDENKRKVIRNILKSNPSLELDILVGLPKAAAFNNTLNEIVNLHPIQRHRYCLYLIDLDNFKALNSAIGHDGADKVIVDIANIFRKYQKQIDDGIWNNKQNGNIKRMFMYRQGGDEFALIIQASRLYRSQQRIFYESWKKDINLLGNKYLNDVNNFEEQKGKETMTERERKNIFHALKGLKISNNTKNEINDAINNKKCDLSLNTIGISVGVYCSGPLVRHQSIDDWLKGAERAQREVKKLVGKNDIRMCKGYYDKQSNSYKEKIFDGNAWDQL
eukprot:513456_1